MNILGSVVEILSPSFVLVRGHNIIRVGEIVNIFSQIKDVNLEVKYGIEDLYFPKGEIKIVAAQPREFYLAEIFRQPGTIREIEQQHPSFLSGILQREVRKEQLPGPWSASLDNPTLPVDVQKKVIVGDLVGRP